MHVIIFLAGKQKVFEDIGVFFRISGKQSSAENKLEKLTENPRTVQTLVRAIQPPLYIQMTALVHAHGLSPCARQGFLCTLKIL